MVCCFCVGLSCWFNSCLLFCVGCWFLCRFVLFVSSACLLDTVLKSDDDDVLYKCVLYIIIIFDNWYSMIVIGVYQYM